ncbi:MAG: transposase [Deltaproteobacteria bacterium]|nr:transposase [Deltaproteobacteria bacterium]
MDENAVVEFPMQEDIRIDLRDVFLGAIRLVLETLLEEEVKSMIGAARYERTPARRDSRNGTYLRQLIGACSVFQLARRVLPEAKMQRCIVHLERNVLSHAPQRLNARLAREVSAVFAASSRKEARTRVEKLKGGLGGEVPEATECLENGFNAACRWRLRLLGRPPIVLVLDHLA